MIDKRGLGPLTFGFDIGIASVGWCVLAADRIIEPGVRAFDKAEDEKGRPLNEHRRLMRTQRTRLRRRTQRLKKLRRLLRDAGLIPMAEPRALDLPKNDVAPGRDIWSLRCRGLDERLPPDAWARVIYHLVKHRGFYAARKSETTDESKEGGKLTQGVKATSALLTDTSLGYRTLGEAASKDPAFAQAKRNKAGEYRKSFARTLLRDELRQLFEAQRREGNPQAGEAIQLAVDELFWAQREPMSAAQMLDRIGRCTFEPTEFRAPKRSWSAERFVWLSKLAHLRISANGERRALTEAERQAAIDLPYKLTKVNYRQVRQAIGLGETREAGFVGLAYGVKRNKKGEEVDPEATALIELKGWHETRKALQAADLASSWHRLSAEPALLDGIAQAVSLHKSDDQLRPALAALGLSAQEVEALLVLDFTDFVQLSKAAITKLLPHLQTGLRYDEACEAAGYRHSAPDAAGPRRRTLPPLPYKDVRNPVVYRSLNQARRVLNALVQRYGSPAYVHVELARDLSKGFDERMEIKRGQDAFRDEKRNAVEYFKEQFGREPRGKGNELLKLRLYREQHGQCAYSQQPFDIARLVEDGYAEIDHVLPYARSFDDSQNNKVLALTGENRQKGNRTPFEYFGRDDESDGWRRFEAWVRGNKNLRKAKRDRLLRRHFDERESEEFKTRNLNDTRWATRLFAQFVRQRLEFAAGADGAVAKAPVLTPAGAYTAFLRARWGLLKNREASDLHHALDACVVAAASPALQKRVGDFHRRGLLQQLPDGSFVDAATGEILSAEQQAALGDRFPQPWAGFREEVLARLSPDPARAIGGAFAAYADAARAALRPVLVSRAVKRKPRGALHEDTVRSVAAHLGPDASSKRTMLSALKLTDLPKIVGAEDPRNAGLMQVLKERLDAANGDAKKAFAEPVFKPRQDGTPGPLIRAVKLASVQKGGVPVRGGVADQASMWRVDVFHKGGRYYLVPIYQADRHPDRQLPNRAVLAYKPREEWTLMDDGFDFRFSLYPNDLMRLCVKGSEFFGYFAGLNVSTAAISINAHDRDVSVGKDGQWSSLGVKLGVERFEKYHVDVLGHFYSAKPEPRHGLA